jgi:sugar lactone lactonase YvrE
LNSIVWDGKYQANPLSPGEYKYSIIAYDSAGNISNQISQIAHIIEDSIPPITELIIGSPHFGSPTIINLNTPLILNASDNASGVKETWYIIDNNIQNFIPPELLPFEFTIGNIEGRHVLKYWSIDSLNNIENIKSESIFVDTTTPITNIILGPPEFDSVYINSNSIIELIANDPVSNEVSSGISEINYKINSSNWHKVHSNKVDFNINGNDGYYIINFNSIDNVENKENLKKDTLILDNTPPILQFIVGEPKYGYDTTYLISVTLITLNVNDGNGSGVKSSDYRVDLDDWINFNSGFEFNLSNYGEGVHLIKLKSIDNLNNIRIINHIFGVDDTPPISELRLDGINFNYGDSTIINSQTNIIITARDSISCGVASGAKDIEYRINYSNWVLTNQDSISFSINGIDSLYKIDYYSIDNVLNTENIKSKYLILDNTSPEVEIISPLDSTLINGTITIIGTAKDAHFKYYELAYNEGVNPSNWNIITHSNIPVYKNLLGEWNTEGLNEGLYTLRLIATDMVGNTNEARIIIYIGKPEFLFEIKDFNKCEGVDVDDVGNIYVSDRNASSNPTHNRIAKYDMFGNFLFQIIDLRKPDDVALSDWGSIFVSEWAGNSVVEYSSEGDSIRSITDLLKPDGIDVKRVKLSNLFNNEEESLIISVADQNHNRILIYDSTLALLSEIVVQHPEGISLSKDGFVYTCLKDNGIIRKYDFNGNVMLEIDGFSSPSDVEIDNRGYIWVVDRNNNRICMFDSTGNMLMNFGGIGNEQGKFNKPEGISLSYEKDNSKVNRVHISDRNNNRVCVFKMPLFGNAQILSGFIKTNEEAIAIKECVPYPNPFNPIKENSNIRIKVNKDCKIEMFIYTLSGKNVWKTNIIGIGGLVNEIEWNGRNNSAELVRNGVYNVLVRAIKDNEKDEAWTKILLYKR